MKRWVIRTTRQREVCAHAGVRARAAALVCAMLAACNGCPDPPVEVVRCPEAPAAVIRHADACRDGTVVVGPVRLDRGRATPRRDRFEFTTAEDGSFCLLLTNGSGEGDRVTAGWVDLDGERIVGPARFRRHVPRIRQTGTIGAGSHVLDVRLASAPGSFVELELRFAPAVSEEAVAQAELLAQLEYEVCHELNRQAGRLDPERAAALVPSALVAGTAPWQMRVLFNAYGVPRWIVPVPEWVSGLPAGSPPTAIARAWLDAHRILFRWRDPRIDLEPIESKSLEGGDHRVRFRQTVSGLPVDGSRLALHVDPEGFVRELFGNFVPDLPDSLAPTVPAAGVPGMLARALPPGEAPTVRDDPKLVVLDLSTVRDEPEVRLAWRVLAVVGGEHRTYWLDAADGSLLHWQRGLEDASDAAPVVYFNEVPVLPAPSEPPFNVRYPARRMDTSLLLERPRCRYPDRGDPPAWEYSGWCPALVETLGWMDLRYRAFGRRGWSGEGIPGRDGDPGIAANDDYRVYYSLALSWYGTSGAVWEPGATTDNFVDAATSDPLPGRSILVFTEQRLHEDIIRHESGHGVHQVEVNYLPTSDPMQTYQATLGEHVADFWALGFGRFDFALETTEGIFRDHAGTGCQHSWWEGCPPEGCGCPVGCEEYGHLAYLDTRVPQPHRNSCILTKVAYLMLREREGVPPGEMAGPIDYHGVSVAPLRKVLGEQIFYKVLNRRLEAATTPQEYGLMLRDQVTLTDLGCRGPDAPTACLGGGEDVERGAAAIGAVGFWSEAYDLSRLDDRIVPESGLAAARAPNGTWVFFVRTVSSGPPLNIPTQHITGVKFGELFDPTVVPLEVTNLTGTAPEWPEIVHPPVAATLDEDVWVGYLRGREGAVRFLHGVGGVSPVPVPSPFPSAGATNQPPALGAIANELLMVYVDAAGGSSQPTLKWVTSSSFPLPRDVGRDREDPDGFNKYGRDPVLVRGRGGRLEHLFLVYATDWRPSLAGSSFMAVRWFDFTRLAWSDEMLVRRLQDDIDYRTRPWNLAAYREFTVWQWQSTAAAFHQGRIQVFLQSRDPVSHMSFVPAPASRPAAVFDRSGTRLVRLLAHPEDRPAAVPMRDSMGRETLVLFWREWGAFRNHRLRASWKLSD